MSQQSRAALYGSKYGLVIVTGGSSGIGKSFIELALKLRPTPLLFNLSRRNPPTFFIDRGVRHLECDLADSDSRRPAFAKLATAIESEGAAGPILLVNNAGTGLYGAVADSSPEAHLRLIELNIASLVELSARLLPFVRQRGGAIMNIASTAAFQATPYLATYGATKAFVLNWTLALNEELRGSRGRAIALCPGPTRTPFFFHAGSVPNEDTAPRGFSQSAEEVAEAAWQAAYGSAPLRIPGWPNKLLVAASALAPRRIQARLGALVLKRMRPNSNQV